MLSTLHLSSQYSNNPFHNHWEAVHTRALWCVVCLRCCFRVLLSHLVVLLLLFCLASDAIPLECVFHPAKHLREANFAIDFLHPLEVSLSRPL